MADHPNWDALYAAAAPQEGLFTSADAASAGYSPQLLNKHRKAGRVVSVARGIHRLVHFPPGDHEDLVAVWLWSERFGVFSHETALSLHVLSDVLPARINITLPASWRHRRLRFPPLVTPHFADISEGERTWVGAVPTTKPSRTVVDCAALAVVPDIVGQAVRGGVERGLFSTADVEPAVTYLKTFGISIDTRDGGAPSVPRRDGPELHRASVSRSNQGSP